LITHLRCLDFVQSIKCRLYCTMASRTGCPIGRTLISGKSIPNGYSTLRLRHRLSFPFFFLFSFFVLSVLCALSQASSLHSPAWHLRILVCPIFGILLSGLSDPSFPSSCLLRHISLWLPSIQYLPVGSILQLSSAATVRLRPIHDLPRGLRTALRWHWFTISLGFCPDISPLIDVIDAPRSTVFLIARCRG